MLNLGLIFDVLNRLASFALNTTLLCLFPDVLFNKSIPPFNLLYEQHNRPESNGVGSSLLRVYRTQKHNTVIATPWFAFLCPTPADISRFHQVSTGNFRITLEINNLPQISHAYLKIERAYHLTSALSTQTNSPGCSPFPCGNILSVGFQRYDIAARTSLHFCCNHVFPICLKVIMVCAKPSVCVYELRLDHATEKR